MLSTRYCRIAVAIGAVIAGIAMADTPLTVVTAVERGCPGDVEADPNVIMCDDFEDSTVLSHWSIGSRGGAWPAPEFLLCGNGSGFGDRCAAWSNYLLFDGSWGYWGYDARRSFPSQSEFHVRWYQHISDPYAWGTLEDKSVLLHDATSSITAYVGTSRNHQPVVPSSGPGMPFVANYQDLDWPETGGQYTSVNRFQNQGNDIALQPGKWYLFEWYVRLNTPGVSDGVTRLWIDDASEPVVNQTLRLHYTDMRWLRSSDAGKQFGVLRLTTYDQRCDGVPNTCPPNGPTMLTQSHRWDQIVISKAPIGPIRSWPVAVASPSNGTIVSGIVPLTASIVGAANVAGVQFTVDGAAFGTEDTTPPYAVPWDTTAFSEGAHLLKAVMREAAGSRTESRAISVTVANRVSVARVEDNSGAVTYAGAAAWIGGYAGDRGWSGGTAALGFSAGQRATLSFTGTGVSWIGFQGPQGGIANIHLDDVLVATVDTYAPMERVGAVLYSTSELAPGRHTLSIDVPDPRAKNESSSDYFVVVDAFDVTVTPVALDSRIEETDAEIAYTGAWSQANTARAWSGGTAAIATSTGAVAQATLNFSGTGVRWIAFKGPQAGVANIYLDGTLMRTVDAYAATEEIGAGLFTASGLLPGTHTLTVEATGTKHPSSTDPFVIVDAFDVAGSTSTQDTTRPITDVTWPLRDAIVSGATPLAAAATDDVSVAGVRFLVDGVQVGPEDTTVPYAINWDTTLVADGAHTVTAVARDGAGNTASSNPLAITVVNAAQLPVPTATRVEDTDTAITYTPGAPAFGQTPIWDHGNRSRAWSNKTASSNRTAGARAAFRFTGTSVRWIGFRAFWAGIANVYIDNVFVAEVDLFLTPCTAAQQMQGCIDEEDQVPVFVATGLGTGNHTLAIEVTGRRNPGATDNAVVIDAFDVAPAFAPPPIGARLEETDSSASYSPGWLQGDAARAWSGGTAAVCALAGARASFEFAGTEVRWTSLRGPQAGIARIFLDGTFHASVDLYSPTEVQGVVFAATGLAAGRHTLAIEVTGLKNPAATSSDVFVDALDVRARFEERDSSVVYSGPWSLEQMDRPWSGTSANAGGGAAARSSAAGARAELTFTGTEVRWIGYRGPSAGIADVSIDGVLIDRIDLYSPTEEIRVPVAAATGLAAGPHTLRIDVSGLQNASATGAFVVVDAFDVALISSTPLVRRVEQSGPTVTHPTGEWSESSPNGLFSGRTVAFSSSAGARTVLTFTGTSVRWIGQRLRDSGIAVVYVDGVFAAEVDTFAPSQDEFQAAVYSRTDLPPGEHTLTIEVTGRKHGGDQCTPGPGPDPPPCSAGFIVAVDAFEIY